MFQRGASFVIRARPLKLVTRNTGARLFHRLARFPLSSSSTTSTSPVLLAALVGAGAFTASSTLLADGAPALAAPAPTPESRAAATASTADALVTNARAVHDAVTEEQRATVAFYGERLVARILDSALAAGLLRALYLCSEPLPALLRGVLMLVVRPLYDGVFVWYNGGQTPGKQLTYLRVVVDGDACFPALRDTLGIGSTDDTNTATATATGGGGNNNGGGGGSVPLVAAVARGVVFAVCATHFVPALLNVGFSLFDGKRRCLHDVVAGTVVVEEEDSTVYDFGFASGTATTSSSSKAKANVK
jgi:uncharacterized RDD family membrane protein YckC